MLGKGAWSQVGSGRASAVASWPDTFPAMNDNACGFASPLLASNT